MRDFYACGQWTTSLGFARGHPRNIAIWPLCILLGELGLLGQGLENLDLGKLPG